VPIALGLTLIAGTIASAAGTWSTDAGLPTPREELGVAAAPCPGGTIAGGCVYTEGGNDPVTTNEIYSTFTNSFSTGAPMPTARNELAVAAARCFNQSGMCIYAVDGDDSILSNKNEAYRPASNTWTTEASDPVAREELGAASGPCPGGTIPGGCVYAIGGNDDTSVLQKNEAYNTMTNSWRTLPDMPTAREDAAAAAAPCPGGTIAGGCVYVVGGRGSAGTELKTVQIYNTFTNSWSTETDMPTARDDLGAAAARCFGQTGTCVYAIGGGNSTTDALANNEALKP
jgi:hypothetical protein